MSEITHVICWRTSERLLRYTRKRLRYFFIEEWVRFYFYIFPLAALPVLLRLWHGKASLPRSAEALLTAMAVAAVLAACAAWRSVRQAARYIKSDYELNGDGLRVKNRARTQTVFWENVRKWTLEPHPYAAGMHMLRFDLITATETHGSRHIDMEVDPQSIDVREIEEFILNRVGFRQAGWVPVYEPLA